MNVYKYWLSIEKIYKYIYCILFSDDQNPLFKNGRNYRVYQQKPSLRNQWYNHHSGKHVGPCHALQELILLSIWDHSFCCL